MSDRVMQAFVLMPFDPEFQSIYADLIKPALEDVGYEVRRADSVIDQHNILRDVVEYIVRADLVIAELTSLNPNVMYELGIAHALAKPTVMLAQRISDVPFDLRSYRIISYSENFREVHKLQDRLKEIAQQHREGTISFGNPVTDFAPSVSSAHQVVAVSAVDVLHISPPMQAHPKGERNLSHDDDLGWLDVQADLERAQQDISNYMQRLGEIAEQINADMDPVVQRLNQSNPQSTSASQRRALLGSGAVVISRFASGVEGELPGLRDAWERFAANSDRLATLASLESETDRQSANEVIVVLEEFAVAITRTLESVVGLKESLNPLRGTTRDLNRSLRQVDEVVDALVGVMEVGLSSAARVKNIIQDRLQDL
jgi:hypothetical protein